MTAITIVKKQGMAAVACDTLSKFGCSKESARYVVNHSKIITVGASYIAVSGPTSGKLVLQDYFGSLKETPTLTTVPLIFTAWKKLHQALSSDYYLRPEEDDDDSFESTRLDVLIANSSGIFTVSAHRSIQELSRFYACGRGAEYALGAMYVAYEDPDKSAEEVALLGVEAAAEFDDSTGPPFLSQAVRLSEN